MPINVAPTQLNVKGESQVNPAKLQNYCANHVPPDLERKQLMHNNNFVQLDITEVYKMFKRHKPN